MIFYVNIELTLNHPPTHSAAAFTLSLVFHIQIRFVHFCRTFVDKFIDVVSCVSVLHRLTADNTHKMFSYSKFGLKKKLS